MPNLTQTFVNKLRYDGKPRLYRDSDLRGFMVSVGARGKSWKIQRDISKAGKKTTIRRTIGKTDNWTAKQAREEAEIILKEIRKGKAPKGGASEWTIGRIYDAYLEKLSNKDIPSEQNITNLTWRRDHYMADLLDLPITAFTRSMARERHKKITDKNGKNRNRLANQVLKDFRAAFNHALKVADDPQHFPPNPVDAVTFNPEGTGKTKPLMPDEMPDWYEKVQALENPLRREMHMFGLLSGLRPGNLISLRRDWLRLDDRGISIPAEEMKGRKRFDLPLSQPMVDIIEKILRINDDFYTGSPWLFTSRSCTASRAIIPMRTWREKTLVKIQDGKERALTGHILRHTWSSISERVKMDGVRRKHLMAHGIEGISGVYIHHEANFDELIKEQERMSETIFGLLKF